MSNKLETVKISGSDYAKVASRLKDFREKNPRADISTHAEPFGSNGAVVFKATIISDLKDKYSARSTASAMYSPKEMAKDKAFEKLETISVGRALSLLGWLNNGEIASTEEIEEFEAMKQDKVEKAINEGIAEMRKAKSLDELKAIFITLDMTNENIIAAKDKKKEELTNENSKPSAK
jgi:ADP-ribosylglycohydrolase